MRLTKSFLPRDSRAFLLTKAFKANSMLLFQWRQVEQHFFSSPIIATIIPKTYRHLQPIMQLPRKGHTLAQAKLILSWNDAVESLSAPTPPAFSLLLFYQHRCAWNCAKSWIRVNFSGTFLKLILLLLLFKSQIKTWDNRDYTPTRKLQLLD